MKRNIGTKTPLEESLTSGEKSSQTSEDLLEQWTELVYSSKISLNLTWSERHEEACRILKFTPSKEEQRNSSRKHFQGKARAEYLWSLIIMCHNVNESLREPESSADGTSEASAKSGNAGNENTSYSSKIKNAASLNGIYELIEKVKLEVFRGDEEAAKDFEIEKYSQESGTFLDQRRKNNAK